MKNNFAQLIHNASQFGFFLYLTIFALPTSANPFLWECEEKKSYLIEEKRTLIERNLKKFPTKFAKDLKKKSKLIKVTYELDNGKANINGVPAILSGNLKKNENSNMKTLPFQPVILVFFNADAPSQREKNIGDSDKKKPFNTKTLEEVSITKNYFVINTRPIRDPLFADYVSTKFSDIFIEEFQTKLNKQNKKTLNNFIEVSSGKCKLLE